MHLYIILIANWKDGEFCERGFIKGIIKVCCTLSCKQLSLLLLVGFSWLFGSLCNNCTAEWWFFICLLLKIMSQSRYLRKKKKTNKQTQTQPTNPKSLEVKKGLLDRLLGKQLNMVYYSLSKDKQNQLIHGHTLVLLRQVLSEFHRLVW